MEVKEFLQNIIDEEYKRYLDGVYEESAEIIEDNSNVFINKEDYEALIGGMIFSQILKNDKTIYGTYMDVINENERVVHIVEVNPMIAFEENYKELEEDYELNGLIKDYTIKETGFIIKMQREEKDIDDVMYVCNFKPILVKKGE